MDTPAHSDRVLGETLAKGLMAQLPLLSPELLTRLLDAGLAADKKTLTPEIAAALIGTAEWPGMSSAPPAELTQLLSTDRLKAALGRIACMYDGGHLMG